MIRRKEDLIVPKGVRYISEWQGFRFRNFPGRCIIDKVLPGCGFTEYCLTGEEDVILTSPRKLLLLNKYEQHADDVFLVVNELDPEVDIDKNLERIAKAAPALTIASLLSDEGDNWLAPEDEVRTVFERILEDLTGYVRRRRQEGKPLKVLVTYDSYGMVKGMLERVGVFGDCYTVIDEFQTILHDSRFKSDTEMGFLGALRTSHTALYVSATPSMEEYLDMLEEFDGLPYIRFDWQKEDAARIKRPNLKVLSMDSVGSKVEEIVQGYLAGKFEKTQVLQKDGGIREVVSDEAVFFLNSVNHIINAIKRSKLSPDQVNILCSNTKANAKRIKDKLGKRYQIGRVPLRGEQSKMFTFCTRTVYLGADFYSTCARSFIFSDSNIETLAVDISEDLPQILGRQRLDENPWRNTATFYYKSICDPRKVLPEEFEEIIKRKQRVSENLLSAFDTAKEEAKHDLARKYRSGAKNENYKDDYVGVNEGKDGKLKPVLNRLVLVSEIRAYKIQQVDYKDRFFVFSNLSNMADVGCITTSPTLLRFIDDYGALMDFRDKLRFVCENNLQAEELEIFLNQLSDSDRIKSYYTIIGPDRLRALAYRRDRIEREFAIMVGKEKPTMGDFFLGPNFNINEKLALSDLKAQIAEFYKSISYPGTPKATELSKYYEVKPVKIQQNNVSVHGLKILSVKPEYQDQYDALHNPVTS